MNSKKIADFCGAVFLIAVAAIAIEIVAVLAVLAYEALK